LFDRIVFTSTNFAFESDNHAFGSIPTHVPEPGSLALFALALMGVRVAARRSGTIGSDHIKFCPGGAATCPFGGGTGAGTFSNGSAKAQTCTATLVKLPALHD
jgi:hypothetical protein